MECTWRGSSKFRRAALAAAGAGDGFRIKWGRRSRRSCCDGVVIRLRKHMSFDHYLGAAALWSPVLCLFGLGLFSGILLRWWAQRTRVYIGTFFKLCHRPRSSDLVWIAAFNQCTVQLPVGYGCTPCTHPRIASHPRRFQRRRHVDGPPQHHR
jgi:hypothetical protein